jgi:hypothetical protein
MGLINLVHGTCNTWDIQYMGHTVHGTYSVRDIQYMGHIVHRTYRLVYGAY